MPSIDVMRYRRARKAYKLAMHGFASDDGIAIFLEYPVLHDNMPRTSKSGH